MVYQLILKRLEIHSIEYACIVIEFIQNDNSECITKDFHVGCACSNNSENDGYNKTRLNHLEIYQGHEDEFHEVASLTFNDRQEWSQLFIYSIGDGRVNDQADA